MDACMLKTFGKTIRGNKHKNIEFYKTNGYTKELTSVYRSPKSIQKRVIQQEVKGSTTSFFLPMEYTVLKNFRLDCLNEVDSIELKIGGQRVDKITKEFMPFLKNQCSRMVICKDNLLNTELYDRKTSCIECAKSEQMIVDKRRLKEVITLFYRDVAWLITEYASDPLEDISTLIPMYVLNVIGIPIAKLTYSQVKILITHSSDIKMIELTYDSYETSDERYKPLAVNDSDYLIYHIRERIIKEKRTIMKDEITWLDIGYTVIVYCLAITVKLDDIPIEYNGDLILKIEDNEFALKLYKRIGDIHVYSLTGGDTDLMAGIDTTRLVKIGLYNNGFSVEDSSDITFNGICVSHDQQRYMSGMMGLAYEW